MRWWLARGRQRLQRSRRARTVRTYASSRSASQIGVGRRDTTERIHGYKELTSVRKIASYPAMRLIDRSEIRLNHTSRVRIAPLLRATLLALGIAGFAFAPARAQRAA